MCQEYIDDGSLTQETCNLIDEFLKLWPQAEFGPAHIVLGDDNVEDCHITWCISIANAVINDNQDGCDADAIEVLESCSWYKDHEKEELVATVAFLEKLLKIPEDER